LGGSNPVLAAIAAALAPAIAIVRDHAEIIVALSTSLAVIALAIGTGGVAIYYAAPAARWRSRTVRPKVLARALLPKRVVRSASGRLDIAALLFSVFLAGSIMGWALFSSAYFAQAGGAFLARTLPALPSAALPGWICAAVTTVALYLAYEFAYWVDHYLSHRVPILWEFHKVHHTAESLSVLTNYRVHPVDTIVFYNIAAVFTGAAAALLGYLFNRPADALIVGGSNMLVFLTSMSLSHLQHSHLWISLPGRWGKWVLSPAHHQIHHSIDVRHYDRNFGSTTAMFDRMFGTLHLPTARREKLTFGVTGLGYDPHGFTGAVLMPFVDAGRHVTRGARRLVAGLNGGRMAVSVQAADGPVAT
jgi:sterol desaturase/sphingolipid hydroxylase (fatty acid hydroxylase superfamily)